MSGAFERQEIDIFVDNHLGLLEHLIFGDPKSGASDGDGEIIDFDAEEIFNGDFDATSCAEPVQFSDHFIFETTERQKGFGEEIAGAARGIEEGERCQFELKLFELDFFILAFAPDGLKFIVEVVEKERIDDAMNIFDARIMHAARPSSDGVESRFKEGAEDGGADAVPIEICSAGKEPMIGVATEIGNGIGAGEEIAVDVREGI